MKAMNDAAASGALSPGLATLSAILLFVGACGKSAQIPLYVWLPDAMEGPTPVSALIHAATMVTAGVYMVARLNGLYSASPAAGELSCRRAPEPLPRRARARPRASSCALRPAA